MKYYRACVLVAVNGDKASKAESKTHRKNVGKIACNNIK